MTNEETIAIIKHEFSKYIDTLSVYAKKRKKAFQKTHRESHCILLRSFKDSKRLVKILQK